LTWVDVRAEFQDDLATIAVVDADDPSHRLIATSRVLAERWLSRTGRIYLPVAVLALHDERFDDVLREIYERFYAVIAEIMLAIDPTATPDQAASRALMITAVLDGASLQPGNTDEHTRAKTTAAVVRLTDAIARGL